MKKTFFVSITLCILLISGCAKYTNVLVSSYSSTSNTNCFKEGATFKVIPELKDTRNNLLKNNNFLSKEIARKIEAMLAERGFEIDNSNNANYNLLFFCTMDSRNVKGYKSIYIPDYSYTQGTVSSYGSFYSPSISYNESTNKSRFEIVPTESTYYDKGLCLSVIENGCSRELVWKSAAVSSNENGDFRNDVNYLIKAAFNCFGINSKRNLNKKISSEDKEIKKLRNL